MDRLRKIGSQLLAEKALKIDIASAFIWVHHAIKGEGLSVIEINDYFAECNFSKYNPTYLKDDLRKSRNIIRDTKRNIYKPAHKFIESMEDKFGTLKVKSEEIITDETILPNSLMNNTRGYLIKLSTQINGSYHYNIFDGCAVLMRRLLEILLIHSYETSNRLGEITNSEGIKSLSQIINYTISNNPFKLSKEVIDMLNDFRQLGNFSAHKIQYNCKRADINNIRLKYRLAVEELLYASGIKN